MCLTVAPNLPLTVFGELPRAKVRVPVVIDHEVENMKALHMIVAKNLHVRDGIRLFYHDKKIFMRLAFHVRRVCRVRLQDCRCSHIGCICRVVVSCLSHHARCVCRGSGLSAGLSMKSYRLHYVVSSCHHAHCVCRRRHSSFIIVALS